MGINTGRIGKYSRDANDRVIFFFCHDGPLLPSHFELVCEIDLLTAFPNFFSDIHCATVPLSDRFD